MLATRALSAVLAVVFGIQFMVGIRPSIAGAGLVKPLVASGEWWRLLTACFLHGNLLHLLFNLSALQVFGRIVAERTSPWHMLVVYLAAGIGGSLCSFWLTQATSIGASGAVLGLVGFSLVIVYREKVDNRDLLVHAGKVLVITGLLGAALYRFIDNAGHLGGAVTGAALGLWLIRSTAVKPLPLFTGWCAGLALVIGAVTAGTMAVRASASWPPAVPPITDHVPVVEANVAVKIWPGLEGVEYAVSNVGTRGITAWEVGFYADTGRRRVGSFAGDVCRPVDERPGWLRPGQTHVESFRRVVGESRHGLSARVDVVLIAGGGFSGSRARYDAMLEGRRFRLTELEAIHATLVAVERVPPAQAEPVIRSSIDLRATMSEESRQPLLISELLAARRYAERNDQGFPVNVRTLIDQTQRMADDLRRCDVR
jgi:membrane associated rhomboid family serine protease